MHGHCQILKGMEGHDRGSDKATWSATPGPPDPPPQQRQPLPANKGLLTEFISPDKLRMQTIYLMGHTLLGLSPFESEDCNPYEHSQNHSPLRLLSG